MKAIREHRWFILIILLMAVGGWILNANITLPYSGILYWDYARHLQAGYIDSPYMLALTIKLYSLVAGTSPLAYGYIKFLLLIISTVMIYMTSYQFTDKKSALICVLMFLALPVQLKFFENLNYHLGVITAFTGVLYALACWQAQQKSRYLYLANLFLGILLLMQFESIFVVLGLALASLGVKSYRKLWSTPAFYIGLLIPIALAVPFIYWEIKHQWLTLKFLSASNDGDEFSLSNYWQALLDYIGSLGLLLLLTIIVFIRQRSLKNFDDNQRFFFYAWLTIALLLNFMFMDNQIRHSVLINANIALFLFLAAPAYKLFPRFTLFCIGVSLLITIIYGVINLRVTYHKNNDLAFAPLIQSLVTERTLILSQVEPYDNAPSYFSIHLKGQPEVYAVPNPIFKFEKDNPAVYMWQPSIKTLLSDPQWQTILVLTQPALIQSIGLPDNLRPYLLCAKPQPLTITVESIKQNLTIFAYQCHKK